VLHLERCKGLKNKILLLKLRKYNQIYNPEKDVSSCDETAGTCYLQKAQKVQCMTRNAIKVIYSVVLRLTENLYVQQKV